MPKPTENAADTWPLKGLSRTDLAGFISKMNDPAAEKVLGACPLGLAQAQAELELGLKLLEECPRHVDATSWKALSVTIRALGWLRFQNNDKIERCSEFSLRRSAGGIEKFKTSIDAANDMARDYWKGGRGVEIIHPSPVRGHSGFRGRVG